MGITPIQQLLNNNASIPSVNIEEQSYPIKAVTVRWRHNKNNEGVTIEVKVNGTSWGTQTVTNSNSNYFDAVFEGTSTTGAVEITFTNNTGSGTGHGTFYVSNVILTEGASGTPAETYAITCNGDDHGTIIADPNPAAENATVTITPAPETGYQLSTLTAYKTGDANTPVSISNNQFTMPGYPVTVDATFETIPTYSITVNGGGSATPNPAPAGETVTVSVTEGKMIDTYTSTPAITLTPSGNAYTFEMPNEAVTINLTLKDKPVQSGRFERINSTTKLEKDVRYLLVYEDETSPAVMGATTTSSTHYGQSVTTGFTLSNGVITLEDGTNAKPLTLGGESGAWTFDLDGSLIGWSSGNSLSSTTNSRTTTWTISFDENNNAIIANTAASDRVIKYNSASGQERFACYTSNQSPIQLYKEVGTIVESSDLYIVGQVNGNDENPIDTNEGVKLTYSQTNNNYTGDFYCTGLNDGNDSGYSFLLFSKIVPYSFSNNSDLYGSGGNGNAWTINESDFGTAIPLYETSTDNFRLPAGLYTVTVALSGAGFEWTDASVTFTTREKTMVISGSQYFEDTRDVTMSSNLTDIGGKIYYTTDGGNPSDPNSSRQEYTGPITISATTTFKAVAFVGNLYSAIVEKTFTKTPKTPVITPNGGTITEATPVEITCETEGASIYYTLDGSTPTNVVSETNFLYSGAFTISETTTVKARAYVGDTYSNGIATAEFVYTEPYVPGEGDFVLVENNDDLKAGREYIIITEDYNWAMGAIDGDAKRAIPSQDFTISEDHSTVTLPENSTVNVIKLVDGIEDPDKKYWNLTQTNGLNIFIQNTSSGMQEKPHGYGLSGYSDEVFININAAKYAIITPQARQILYQDGSNGAAGVFGHYANSNAGASGYKRVYLYYREGATVPPTEATLAQIIALGENADGKLYKISNEEGLLGVYSQGTSVWFKDEEQAVDYQAPQASDKDYTIVDDVLGIEVNEKSFDQSNWIEVVFQDNASYNNKYVKNLTGTYSWQNGNPKLTLTVAVDATNDVSDADPYSPNPYTAANFVGSQQGYFFSSPKAQEYAQIMWATWDGTKFNMPSNGYGFTGSFTMDDSMNSMGTSGMQEGKAYNFKAIIRKVSVAQTQDGAPMLRGVGDTYQVYPLDLNPGVVTGVGMINVNGEVKSVKYVNVAGIVSDVPFQGVNIVVTEYTDGSRTTTKMLKK